MHDRKILYSILANIFIPLAGISTDIYLPSLPALTHHFAVAKEMVQYTVTSFAIGMGVVQLIAGPVCDALGRKRLLLVSAIVQIIAILLILFTPTMTLMIVYRFIQGSAAAFMIVPARAILNDMFDGDALKKQYNYATISFALGPILGPFIGGYLQTYFDWHANFVFILCYAVITLVLVIFVYHETIAQKRKFSVLHLWHNYCKVCKNHLFVVSCIFTACLFGYTAFFNVSGPFLIEVTLGKSPVVFGHMALVIGVAWFLGNVLNRFLFIVNNTLKVCVGLFVTCLAALVMLIFGSLNYMSMTLIVVPMFFMIMMSGGVFSMFTAECLSMFRDLAASANAFLFGCVWIAFSIFSYIAATTKAHTLVPIGSALLGESVLCVIIFYIVYHMQKKVSSKT